MKKISLMLVFSFFAIFLISCGSSPEEKLANHIDEIAEIMSENEEDPKVLVDELDEYLNSNFGNILSAFGEALTELNDLDVKEASERVAVMGKELYDAVERNKDIFESFAKEYNYDRDYYHEGRDRWVEGDGASAKLEDLADALEDKFDSQQFDIMAMLEKADELDLDKPSEDAAKSLFAIGEIINAISRTVDIDDDDACNRKCQEKAREFEDAWEDAFRDIK